MSYAKTVPSPYFLDSTGKSCSPRRTNNAYATINPWAKNHRKFAAPSPSGADASENCPNGSINKVEFFRSETLLGALTSPPYRYNLTNANAGYFLLNAIATDNKGVTGSSSLVIVINGPNALPTIALTAPSNGALFTAPANINLSANASDSDGSIVQVDFLRNGEVFGED